VARFLRQSVKNKQYSTFQDCLLCYGSATYIGSSIIWQFHVNCSQQKQITLLTLHYLTIYLLEIVIYYVYYNHGTDLATTFANLHVLAEL